MGFYEGRSIEILALFVLSLYPLLELCFLPSVLTLILDFIELLYGEYFKVLLSPMYHLYHYPLCPFSRKVRVMMSEQGIEFVSNIEFFWKKRDKFQLLNPMGTVPFLLKKPSLSLAGSQAMIELFEEIAPQSLSFISGSPEERAEIRRIVIWFDEKFFREVSETILYQRVFNFFRIGKQPDQDLIAVARANLPYHMRYLDYLLSKRDFLASDAISLADLVAACHISSLDYLDEIFWSKFPAVKDWYSIIKSRPSFKDILNDNISGFKPPEHYRKLDF